MNLKKLKNLIYFLENKVLKYVGGVRKEGDLTSQNKMFPDTYYYYSFAAEYDEENQTIRFDTVMLAETEKLFEFGEYKIPGRYEDANVSVVYDIHSQSISVQIDSFEDDEFMCDILNNLEYKIEENEAFLNLLIQETKHIIS